MAKKKRGAKLTEPANKMLDAENKAAEEERKRRPRVIGGGNAATKGNRRQ